MRRLLTWLGLAAGALAFWRWTHRRPKPAPPAEDDPAVELKRKLAESRSEEQPATAEPEPPPEEPNASIDERRRAVHDRARQAIDEMLGGDDLPGEETK
jgi:outer membrane biosynthesis protein TonB